MVDMAKKHRVIGGHDKQFLVSNSDNTIVYKKGGAYFAFNFDPTRGYDGYKIPVDMEGEYQVILSTDDYCFGGWGRIWHMTYTTQLDEDGKPYFLMYLPSRTAAVFKRLPAKKK